MNHEDIKLTVTYTLGPWREVATDMMVSTFCRWRLDGRDLLDECAINIDGASNNFAWEVFDAQGLSLGADYAKSLDDAKQAALNHLAARIAERATRSST